MHLSLPKAMFQLYYSIYLHRNFWYHNSHHKANESILSPAQETMTILSAWGTQLCTTYRFYLFFFLQFRKKLLENSSRRKRVRLLSVIKSRLIIISKIHVSALQSSRSVSYGKPIGVFFAHAASLLNLHEAPCSRSPSKAPCSQQKSGTCNDNT